MNYRGHRNTSFIGSLLTFAAGLFFFHFQQAFVLGGLTFLGGLFPDLDTESTPSKWAARFGVLLSLYAIFKDKTDLAVYYSLLFMLAKSDKHRGWTHSIFLPVAISAISYKLNLFHYGLAFSFGIYIHILSDSKLAKRILEK
jgi:membrane-bound metal-dependent hydrolase YbcI (DUF457 family)